MSALATAAALLLASGAAASFQPTSGHASVYTGALLRRLHDGDKPKCHAACNGEEVKDTDITAESWPLYECWGKFTFTCEDASKDKTVTSHMKCDGAMTSKREKKKDALSHGASPVLKPPNGTESISGCEGVFSSFIKIVSSSDAADLEPALSMKKCRKAKYQGGTKALMTGMVCSGMMRSLIEVGEDGSMKGGCSCSRGSVSGAAVKFFPQRKSRKHVAKKLRKAEKVFRKVALRKAHRHHRHHHHHERDVGAEDEATDAAQWAALQKSVRNAGAPVRAASCPAGAAAARGHGHGECELMCNGKKRKLNFWGKLLPCWGELDFKCKGSSGKTCFEDDFECTGVAWPIFKSCKGSFVNHKTVAMDLKDPDDFSTAETLELNTGYKRFMGIKKDGWKGVLAFARGHSSTRYHVEYGKPDAQATVGDLAEPADEQLAVRD